MAMSDEGPSGNAGAGEPLIGRGSARRGDGTDPAIMSDRDPDPDEHPPRSIPRPPLAAPRRGWSMPDSVTQIANGSRTRLALGVALVVVLAAGWIAVGGRGARPSAGPPAPRLTTTSRPRPPTTFRVSPIAHAVSVPTWVPRAIAATCRARATTTASLVVDCTPGRGVISLRYRHFASLAALHAAYATAPSDRGGTGPPKCASGATDERSWSLATAPNIAVGRYRCALVDGHARIVWTSERECVLASADRADAELRSLYEWWTTVPGPTTPAPG